MNLRDRVVEMKEEVEELRKESQENTFAMDLLKELKATSKRKDIIIIIIILISVIVAMVIGFFIFIRQFEVVSEETTEQHIEDINNAEKQKLTKMAEREKEHYRSVKEMLQSHM